MRLLNYDNCIYRISEKDYNVLAEMDSEIMEKLRDINYSGSIFDLELKIDSFIEEMQKKRVGIIDFYFNL